MGSLNIRDSNYWRRRKIREKAGRIDKTPSSKERCFTAVFQYFFLFLIRGRSMISSLMIKIVELIINRSDCILALPITARVGLWLMNITHRIVGRIKPQSWRMCDVR